MGRIRSIKPEVLDDEVAAALSDKAWRLWVSSWVLADDYGCLRMGSKYLAAQVWQESSIDPTDAVVELIRAGFVRPYAVRGQRYGQISGWTKHQRIDNAGKIGKVADPSEDDGSWDPLADADDSVGRVELRAEDRSPTSIRALSGNLAAENAMPKVVSEARGSRVVGARNPAAGRDHDHERDHDRDPDQAGAHAHARIQVVDPPGAESHREPDREPPSADRGFEVGTAGSQAARDAFVDAVAAATKSKFTLNRAPFHAATLCDVLNTHAPAGSKPDRLAWLATTVAAWVAAADPAFTAGWAPAKFLDWLNAGKPARSAPGGRPVQKEKKVKYLTDEEATRSPLTPEQQAAREAKYAGFVPPPTLNARPARAAPESNQERVSGSGTGSGASEPRSALPGSILADEVPSSVRRVVP